MAYCRSSDGWYWLAVVLPGSATALFAAGHPWAFLILAVVVTPLADAVIGRDAGVAHHGRDVRRWLTAIPLFAIGGWLCAIAVGAVRAVRADVPELVGLVLGAGVLSALSMAHIHEVMHSRNWALRFGADVVLLVAAHPHYRATHKLHHANVGDPSYGSTAQLGDSVWRHAFRSLFFSLRRAIDRKSTLTGNRVLCGFAVWFVLATCAFIVGSWRELCFFVGYGMLCVFLVEAVGYLQHYGLCPDRVVAGSPVAWNVDLWLSNRLLANNGYHTMHHDEQTLSYTQLALDGPCLPGGYFHMLWLALIPPLWFSTMNNKVRDLTQR